ncbi:MAG: ABC transporter ATP-binding protein [Thermodesulfobacteriota bacterium]
MRKLWLFRQFFWIYKYRILILLVFIFLNTLIEGVGVGLFFPLIEYIQKGEAIVTDKKFMQIFRAIQFFGLEASVSNFIWAIFIVLLLSFLVFFITHNISARTYNPIMKAIRDEGFNRIINYPLPYFHSTSSGTTVNTLMLEVEHVGQSLNFLISMVIDSLSVLVYSLFLLLISWKLTLIIALAALARYLVSGIFIKKMRRLGKETMQVRRLLNKHLISIFQGIEVIKLYTAEAKESSAFKKLTQSLLKNVNAMVMNQQQNRFFDSLIGFGGICIIIYFAVSRFSISSTSLIVFLAIVLRIVPKISTINDARIRIAEYTAGINFIEKAFRDDTVQPVLKWGEKSKKKLYDKICFESVHFSYPNSNHYALSDINLCINANETIAIVGESGAGKSTFIRLLLRLFDPDKGRITVDGIDLNEIKRSDWRRLVSVVSQDTFIFDDTVENNIKYGVDDDSYTDEEKFWLAVKQSRSEEFINALPEKVKTELGERGVKLSGGQRQRIAIARAFMRDSDILVLDEATSALDSGTEQLIQEAIYDLSRNRTVIAIAHRLSTVKNADRIVVFNEGKITEIGTHQSLIEKNGIYRKYYETQIF